MNPVKLIKTLIGMRSPRVLFYRITELLFGYPLYFFSLITPRDRSKWVFGTNVGFIDNAKYLYIYVNEKGEGIKPIWITKNKNDMEWIRSCGGKAYTKYSFMGLFHSLTAGKYIYTYHSSDINFFTSGNAKKINLWHGVGIKGGNGGRSVKNTSFTRSSGFLTHLLMPYYWENDTLFLSTSDMMDEHFCRMFSLKRESIVNSIYPRCYYLCLPQSEINHILNKYEKNDILESIAHIKKFKKSFLYMPTWRGNLNDDFIESAGFNFEVLNEKMKLIDSVFIFKLHPAVKNVNNISGKKYSNLIFLNKQIDIYPILPFVDCLITDYSSIYYDFILLDKEILLYPFDKEEYINMSNDLAFNYDEFTPGHRVYSFDELLGAITSSNRDYKVKDRERILQSFWGKTDINSLDYLYNSIKAL